MVTEYQIDFKTQRHRDHRGNSEFVIVTSLCPLCLCASVFQCLFSNQLDGEGIHVGHLLGDEAAPGRKDWIENRLKELDQIFARLGCTSETWGVPNPLTPHSFVGPPDLPSANPAVQRQSRRDGFVVENLNFHRVNLWDSLARRRSR